MAEAENNNESSPLPFADETVAIVVPLFPRLPGVRESLASLATQTRPPNLVVLLDDGTNPEAESLQQVIPSLTVEVVQVESDTLTPALASVIEYLANFDFIGFLRAGDRFAPTRIEQCLRTLLEAADKPWPMMVVTGILPVDGRGHPLSADDPRTAHLARLWAPGRAGAGLADWLGVGNFAGPLSNIFARREHLAAHGLPADTPHYHQAAVLVAGLQGLLAVAHEPLLLHYPPPLEREPTPRVMADLLQTQVSVLRALQTRLPVSPETRRHVAAYHRAAWNNLSFLREDLFQQVVLRLAASADEDAWQSAVAEVLRSREAQTMPAHWTELLEGADPLDLAGYAQALRRTRAELAGVSAEKQRLGQIATAAQACGWVQFGAWIGERHARRVMELEESEKAAPPKDDTEGES